MTYKLTILVQLALLLLLMACQPSGNQNLQDLSDQYELTWAIEDSLSLTGSDSLELKGGLVYMMGQRAIVLNHLDLNIWVFDPQGTKPRIIGRFGNGPGEFSSLQVVTGDTSLLIALDMSLNRISMFDTWGNYLGANMISRGENDSPYIMDTGFKQAKYCGNGQFLIPISSGRYIDNLNEEFYQEPSIGLYDTTGSLIRTFAPRADIYMEHKFLAYMNRVLIDFDEKESLVYLSQEATHVIEGFNLKGEKTTSFGFPAKYGNSKTPFSLPRGGESKDYDYPIMKAVIFQDVVVLDDYILHFYRIGLPQNLEGKSFHRYDKPLYVQVYDKEGNLLADEPAPADWFSVKETEGNDYLWATQKGAYNEENYSFTIKKVKMNLQKIE